MRKYLILFALALLVCSSAMAQCTAFSSGVPISSQDCHGHSASTCNGTGTPPPNMCCVECVDSQGCHFAAFGSCDDGGSGGGGQCQGQRCTEAVVTPAEKNHGWFVRSLKTIKELLHIK